HTRWPRDWSSDVCSSDLSLHASRSTLQEIAGRFSEERQLVLAHVLIVNQIDALRQFGQARVINPPTACKTLQTDQQRVAGEGRGRRIGRISICRRTQRQHLP